MRTLLHQMPRFAPLHQGNSVEEWCDQGYTLGLGEPSEASTNYLKMDKQSSTDFRYVLIIDDNDNEFLTLNPDDDQILLSGAQTDLWEIYYASSPQTAPVRAVGEHGVWLVYDGL